MPSLGHQRLTLASLRRIARGAEAIQLDQTCLAGLLSGVEVVDRVVASDEPAYGINTGFGKLAQTRIPPEELEHLQHNLVLSHAAGTGPLLGDDVVRLVLALKVASLAQGYSGVRPETVEALVALYQARVYPCIPAKGSVGASGDLAPLAHVAATLLGVGEVRIAGERRPAGEGLRRARLAPMRLAPKEGLALLNGTQVSTALALAGLFAIEDAFAAALVAGALSVDAAMGSDTPFDPRIHRLRGQPGQVEVAAHYRDLLAGSAIRASHLRGDDRVQDPYSLRCQPQVMGACLDVMRAAARTLEIEANGVSDNPLVFAESGEILSGGNFHAEPVALAADTLAIACAEIGALAERRIALLIDASISRLPPFLVKDSGLNSGFMVAQIAAASLASENKSLAHPASVDSLPTSANQEDHVSMATFAARRLADIADNCTGIVAIELLAAAQGVDLRAPLQTSASLQAAIAKVRAVAAHYAADRFFAPDIEAVKRLVSAGAFNAFAGGLLPSGG
ncbi:MAG: histidine ammonia-lyase [Betaproteobacteria bacterium]|jgi:histidine ammonia-lyase|nr:histidine ammonia-lyase [Betaproteobacteria bacterium]